MDFRPKLAQNKGVYYRLLRFHDFWEDVSAKLVTGELDD